MVESERVAYSVNEAARLLSISPRKLTYLISMREIRSFKVGKSRRITNDAIQEFVKKSERAAR